MARMLSAAQIKGKTKSKLQSHPRPGTRTRAVYDKLLEHKGLPVQITVFETPQDYAKQSGLWTGIRHNLENYYGLDIRTVPSIAVGGWGKHQLWWILAGEWFGSIYLDYIAERENAAGNPELHSRTQHPSKLSRSASDLDLALWMYLENPELPPDLRSQLEARLRAAGGTDHEIKRTRTKTAR